MGQNLIAQQAAPGEGNVQEYIGHPGVQYGFSNSSLTSGDGYKNDMEHRFLIARMVPMLPRMTDDHNIYQGRIAWDDFSKDLKKNSGNLCTIPRGKGEFKIILSSMVPINESYTNEYGSSELLQGMTAPLSGGMMSDLAFMTNKTKILDNNATWDKEAGRFKGKGENGALDSQSLESLTQGNTVLKGITDAVHKGVNAAQEMAQSMGMSKQMSDDLVKVANKPCSKVDWPLVWKNCSFQQQYEVTTRLYCYNTRNNDDYCNLIVAPIAALQQFVCPRSDDGWLYEWPFMCTFDIYGVVHMPLAYISNLSVIKGGDVSDFALSGRPNVVDLRFTVSSVYSVCVSTPIGNESQNPERPAISKDQRGLKSYRNWGDYVSPNLSGKAKDRAPMASGKRYGSVTELMKAAKDNARETEKAAGIPGSKVTAQKANEFLYTAMSDVTGMQNSERNLEEAKAQNKKAAEEAAAAAQSAAEADIEKEMAETAAADAPAKKSIPTKNNSKIIIRR